MIHIMSFFHELVCSFKSTLIIFCKILFVINSQWPQQRVQWSGVTYCFKYSNWIICIQYVFHVSAPKDHLIAELSSFTFYFFQANIIGWEICKYTTDISVVLVYMCQCLCEAKCNYQRLPLYKLLPSVNCWYKAKSNRIHKMCSGCPISRQHTVQLCITPSSRIKKTKNSFLYFSSSSVSPLGS